MPAANICRAIGGNICCAMVDREDDPKIDVKTSDIASGCFGVAATMICRTVIRVFT